MKLTKILTIRANLRCLSGLHIGGGDTEMHIGGIDNAVVRNPLTGRPYIPGSSLKGKIRSLLEWRTGAVKPEPLSYRDYQHSNGNTDVLTLLKLFGTGGSDKLTDAESYELGPTRLSATSRTNGSAVLRRPTNCRPKRRAKMRSTVFQVLPATRVTPNG